MILLIILMMKVFNYINNYFYVLIIIIIYSFIKLLLPLNLKSCFKVTPLIFAIYYNNNPKYPSEHANYSSSF